MKVALILVNYNCQSYLPDLFASLAKLDYPLDQCDIFFVDNASDDDSLIWAKKAARQLKRTVYFMENKKNLGFSAGNNLAIQQVLAPKRYDYIVLLNIDTVVDKNWLKELVKDAQQEAVIGAVQSLLLLYDQPELINSAGNKLHYLGFGWSGGYLKKRQKLKEFGSVKNQISEIGYASGAAVLYKASVLRQVGLLDRQFFMYHEDLEMSWRIRLAGFKVVLAPQSIVYHKYQFSRHKKKWFWTERNRLLVYFSLYKSGTILVLVPIFIMVEIGILFYSLLSGWFWYKMRCYLELLLAVPYIIKKRRQIAILRQRSDQEILAKMSVQLDFIAIRHPLITYLLNPILEIYFRIANRLIIW